MLDGIAVDQVFVSLKHWVLGYSPAVIRPGVSILLTIIPILLVFPVLFALTTVLERKGLGRIQNRYGPNRVGYFGILQPMADALKSLTKEDIVPASADHTVHFLAPLVLLAVAFLPFKISSEKQKLEDMRNTLIHPKVKPLTNLDLTIYETVTSHTTLSNS